MGDLLYYVTGGSWLVYVPTRPVLNLLMFGLMYAALHHERWRRPPAFEVWERYGAWCRGEPASVIATDGSCRIVSGAVMRQARHRR